MDNIRQLVSALAAGCLAGLTALVVEETLAMVMLSFPGISATVAGIYLGAGALAALVVEISRRGLGREPWGRTRLFAAAAAVLYVLALCERIQYVLETRMPASIAFAVAVVVGLAGFAVWIAALARIAGPPGETAVDAAMLLAALTAAAGLAVNRNLDILPLEAKAFAIDAAVLLGILALAVLVRIAGPRSAALAVAGLGAAAVATALVPWPLRPAAAESPERPHVLLLSIDTLRQDVFQDVVDTTPEGRAFKVALGDAVWFTNSIAAAPWTAPSIGSVMTGLYPTEHGYGSHQDDDPSRPLQRLSPSVATLAEHFHDNGYHTLAVVTNTILHPVTGISRGFVHYELLEGAKLSLLTILKRLDWMKPVPYLPADTARRRFEHHLDDLGGAPFFVWLHLMDPHQPFLRHRLPADPGPVPDDPDERLYRDETRFALGELARVLSALAERGLADDTAVAFFSDHGEMFPADGHQLPAKHRRSPSHGHALYEELVRVPLVIRPPRVSLGGWRGGERRVDAIVSHMDLYNTLADLVGLDLASIGEDRVSLVPWLGAAPVDPPARHYALSGANRRGPPQRAVRTDAFKLITYPAGEKPDELYDLATDPGEQHNLAARDEERLRRARELLETSWSQLAATPEDALPATLDAEALKRLEALGYIN